MLREELSSGSELTAAWMLVNSPKAASCLTITAPEGGDVRDSRFARLSLAEILEDQIRKARKEKRGLDLRQSISVESLATALSEGAYI